MLGVWWIPVGWEVEFNTFGILNDALIDASGPRDHGKPTPIHWIFAIGQGELEVFPLNRTNTTAAIKVDFDRYMVTDYTLEITFQCLRSIR